MPLSLYLDNRAEPLLNHLIDFLMAPSGVTATSDPFARDVIITPSLGLGRWLEQGIARRLNIASGIELQLPGRFLWQTMSRLLDDVAASSPFEPQTVRWIIYSILVEVVAQPDLEPDLLAVLHGRFSQRHGEQTVASDELLVLSTQIAEQFAQLLNFRRDWLDRWASGEYVESARADSSFVRHEVWLSWIWRQTLLRMPDVSARHPYDRFYHWMRTTDAAEQVRQFQRCGVRRVAVYGLAPMSPEQVRLFGQFSQSVDLAFFVPDPSREFWQDLVSPRYLAEIRASRPDIAWLYDAEPVVLGSWGRMQRDYLAQLRGIEESLQDPSLVRVIEDFRTRDQAEPNGRLQALQQALLNLSDQPWQHLQGEASGDRTGDQSLQIHACHGTTRQVEVLRDVLLQAFQEIADLRPEEVRVFAPDIEDFADAIDGVFGDAQIPYSIEGRGSQGDPLVQAFKALLRAAGAPVSSLVIRSLLEEPALASSMAVDAAEASLLSDWLERSGFRYVTDAPDGKHDWHAAIEGLWLGLCMNTEDAQIPVVQVDRMAIPGLVATNLEQLGKLEHLFGALARLAQFDRQRPDVREWCTIAAREVELWFGTYAPAAARLQLLDRLQLLGEQAQSALLSSGVDSRCRLSLGAFSRLLDETDPASDSIHRAASGLSFASIGTLGSVPARVTAWLGLSDRAFPRQQSPLEFDLLQARPRFGDVSPGNVDRGAFLDVLCMTSDRFILLFDGYDIRSNERLNPSLLIEELLAYVRSQPEQSGFQMVEHPLMRFSPSVFSHPDWPSFDAAAFKAAQKLAGAAAPVHGEPMAPVAAIAPVAPIDSRGDVSQREWVGVLAKPALAYLRHGLGLELPRSYLEVSSDPPLDPFDDLGSNFKQRAQTLLDLPLNQLTRTQIEQVWRLQPYLPQAAMGLLAVQRLQAVRDQRWLATAEHLQLAPLMAGQEHGLAIRRLRWHGMSLETAMLDINNVLSSGDRAQIAWSAFAEGAYAAIDTWLRHQVARLVYPGESVVTYWFGDKSSWQIRSTPDDPAAEQLLRDVAQWVERIKSQPLELFPKTYFAWVRARQAEELDLSLADSMSHPKVKKATEQAFDREQLDRSHVALYLNGVPVLQLALEQSEQIYRPLFESLK